MHLLVEDRDAHVADDQLAPLGLHLPVLPYAVGGVVLEHVDLREGKHRIKRYSNNSLIVT